MRLNLPLIVKAEPVNHRLMRFQPEQTRRGIARLRRGRQRADFSKTETGFQHAAHDFAILVETGRHAERVGECHAHQALFENMVIDRRAGAQLVKHFQPVNGQPVGALRRQGEQQRAQAAVKAHPTTSLSHWFWSIQLRAAIDRTGPVWVSSSAKSATICGRDRGA